MRKAAIFTVVLAVACGDSSESDPKVGPTTDASACGLDGAPGVYAPDSACGVDEPCLVGEQVRDFELQDCDGNAVRFSDVLSSAELVMLNVGAGWCQACIEKTITIQDEVFAPYCGGGLRIVQILQHDELWNPATKFFCRKWRDRYGLTFPVLVDPLEMSSDLFDKPQLPMTMLVDPNGTVLYSIVGENADDIGQEIESRLP